MIYGDEVTPEEEILRPVDDYTRYYNTISCIQIYLSNININSSAYYARNEENEYEKISDEKIKQNIYNLLSKDYIEKNNVTANNIFDFIKPLDKTVFFVPLEMNNLLNTRLERYIVHGIITDTDYNYLKELYLIINLDIVNNTFSVEPVEGNINNINDINIENNNSEIQKNDGNIHIEKSVDYRYISRNYFDNYKIMMLANPEIAYKYLDEEYKQKRFGNLENYKKYIEEYKSELSKIIFKEYAVDTEQDYTSFACKDQNGNMYIFKETSNLNYTIFLDEYTVPDNKIIEKYKDYNTQSKVAYNINKIINMVNIKDYKSFYNVLNENFKNTNFETEEKLEQFLKNNLFNYNKIEYADFNNEGDIYIYNIIIKDATNTDEKQINMSVIMKLKDNMDFEVSFNIK